MGQRDEIWDDMKEFGKQKFDADRKKFKAEAVEEDDGGWTQHTKSHWSRKIDGKHLDYWPTRKKFQFNGKIQRGDVMAFIKRKTKVKT